MKSNEERIADYRQKLSPEQLLLASIAEQVKQYGTKLCLSFTQISAAIKPAMKQPDFGCTESEAVAVGTKAADAFAQRSDSEKIDSSPYFLTQQTNITASPLLIVEGPATADSIYKTTGLPVMTYRKLAGVGERSPSC